MTGFQERIDLPQTKKAFLLLSATCLVLLPLDASFIYWPRPRALRPVVPTLATVVAQPDPESAYLSVFDGNTLFGGASQGSSGIVLASASEQAKDYRLKGIVLTDNAEAIIEDARNQKTVFVKKGELLGSLIVKEIRDGLVILDYLGQEVKLEVQ